MDNRDTNKALPAVSFEEFAPTSYEQWKAEAVNSLKGAPFEKKLLGKTYEGITLQPIYTPCDTNDLTDPLTYPGCHNFLRHRDASGYLAAPWQIAQASEALLPEEANRIIHQELAKGSDVVNITLNRAALGSQEQSERGVLLENLADLKELLQGIDLSKQPIHIYAGASAAPLLGLLTALDQEQLNTQHSTLNTQAAKQPVTGCLGADPLGFLAASGNLSVQISRLYDEMAAAVKWSQEHAPGLKTILVRGDVYHNAGANAVQEVAYCFATAIAYIEAMPERGIDIDLAARQIRFSFSLGANFFMEIAKLRAARLAWSQIIDAFGGGEEAKKIEIFARNSYFTQTVYDPYVNLLRATSQAFSGIAGGVNTMQIAPFDEAVRPSDPTSRRIARNLQIMLQNEFNLLGPIDPGGGSWYIEKLTAQIAEEAWAKLQTITAEGGMLEALRKNFIQEDIGKVLAQRFKDLATRKERAVGTNMYANTGEQPLAAPIKVAASGEQPPPLRGTPFGEGGLGAQHKIEAELFSELDKFTNSELLIENIAAAARTGATLAEIRHALDQGAADDIQITPLEAHRWTEEFESLRQKTQGYQAQTGKNIRVFLANMGPIPQHKARADFSAGFMEVANFQVLRNDGFPTVAGAAQAALAAAADVVVICSTDDTYPELVPPLAEQIKAAAPEIMVLLAGMPAPEHKEAYLAAGVDDFIHIRANCHDILSKIQQARGIRS
ncbi:MAG: acyl-CoA mutase large subunit family protein [Clostridiales bacterium]|nr:acyl-CoA mutase large subunit family protein [Clostridiales bacterium]